MNSITGSIPVIFADQMFQLLPDRALWWPTRSTLVVADVHFGKSSAFRMQGVPVPAGATAKDLNRLTSLLLRTGAQRLIILGDFIHSRAGRQTELLDAIAAWRRLHAQIPIVLVRGNHDRSSGRIPAEWDIQEVEEPFVEEGICLAHDPECNSSCPILAGHVHPVISLQDYDRSAVTLPCFVFDEMRAILPSFGTFTGGFRISRQDGRRIFVVAGNRIVPLPVNG
jgi:DNA ligase-associated metallophosphoesterase